jgi:hypothetical protein
MWAKDCCVADPVAGQVALRTRLKGRDTLAAIRLKIDRGRLSEIEQLHAGNIAPQAIELLTTPPTVLTEDVPPNQECRVEAAPFVTIPYGLGNGWTPDSGR